MRVYKCTLVEIWSCTSFAAIGFANIFQCERFVLNYVNYNLRFTFYYINIYKVGNLWTQQQVIVSKACNQ